MQHKILAPNLHLHRCILATLQRLHTVNNGNNSAEPQPTLTSNEMFSTYIPTSLLNEVLLLMKIPTISSDARTLTLESIESAFLDVDHTNITTLSWLSQAYFGIHKHSPDAILDVVEVLLNTTHSRSTEVYTSTFLLQRYVNLCLTFPNSTPHKYTLTPIVNVLHQHAHAANLHGVDTQNKDVSQE